MAHGSWRNDFRILCVAQSARPWRGVSGLGQPQTHNIIALNHRQITAYSLITKWLIIDSAVLNHQIAEQSLINVAILTKP